MNGVRKKRASRGGRDTDDVLCCCEYINQKGERSHLAACLCDCEDLDEACDRWITCKSLQPEVLVRAIETASDRFRVPWIRGAKKVDLSVLPPLVLLPISLHVAAFHVLLGVVVLSSLPILVIWYYQLTHRRKGKTLLFLSLALFSLGYMYYIFVQEVLLKGHIGWGHFSAITCGLLLTLLCLSKAKQDPGYLSRSPRGAARGKRECANGVSTAEDPAPRSQTGIQEENVNLITEKNWCKICQVLRPPRGGHCRICGSCVQRMDHHCVWINNCIGARNHKFFILLLVIFQFTSIYGLTVTLSAVCRGRSVVSALFYCPGVYTNYSTSFAFTCVWYCAIITAGMGYVLVIQLLNISYNVTEREARIALREKTGRCILGGLVVDTGTFNQGLLQNWLHFLSVDCEGAEQDLPDIV
ncbi:palmitoyltransferase ZDHHC23 [Bufo gargarizans]|uniref:palmitoyltransferase ZDHHC23 n=1 Tax=Bufo gargarizans TaxID=30331 RepID=UPI001CF3C3C0|nr:palmitoyltransferase ZDHHC23 [Bufo gargarizans]